MTLRRLLSLGLLIGAPLLAVGCQKDEPVTSYTVEHADRQKLRLLAAIIPHGEKIWFFRLSGPDAAVAEHKAEFDQLINSVRIDDTKDPPIQWEAPAGWKEQKGNALRFASFRIDARPQPLDVTVTPLANKNKAASVLDNVNRWRGQINLPAVDQQDLDRLVQRKQVADQEVIAIDMAGAGTHVAAAPVLAAQQAQVPQVSATQKGTKNLPFTFDVPTKWTKKSQPSGFSVVTYEAADAGKTAEVTLTPLGGPAGGFAANVNRWRKQIGLPEVNEDALLKDTRPLKAAGVEAKYVDLDSPNGPPSKNRILGVILPQEGTTWFIKMTGPRELVGREKENFERFVQSFKQDAP